MKKFCLVFISLCMLWTASCARDPWGDIVSTLNDVEFAMRTHVDDPDVLISELDRIIEKSGPALAEAHRQIDNTDQMTRERWLNIYKKDLLSTITRITDLDLEIQDRLKDNPEKLNAYISRINRLGRVTN